MKKIISFGLVASLLLFLVGCAADTGTTAPSGIASTSAQVVQTPDGAAQATSASQENTLPITTTPITLKIFVRQSTFVKTDWNEMLQWQEMEKRTGIHADWTIVLASAIAEKRNLAVAGGDLPDIFFGVDFTSTEFVQYADEGIFIPLAGLIEQYAPHINAKLNEDPDIRRGLTLTDGNIYSVPKISENVNQRNWGKHWYYKPLLDELGVSIPTTTDEFFDYLTKVAAAKPDMIPFSVSSIDGFRANIGGAFGLYNRGIKSKMFDFDESTGGLRFIPTSDRYKEMLQYLNRLYVNRLIPQDITILKLENLTADASQGKVATFIYNHNIPAGNYQDDFIHAPEPLKGPYGDQLMPNISPKIQVVSSFMITKANKHPVESIRWMDYLLSPEGEVLYYMGIEGVSYFVNDQGEYHYNEFITNNPNGLSLDEAISLYSIWPASNTACVRQVKYTLDHPDGNSKFVSVGELLMPFTPKEVWPADFWYTPEENTEITSILVDLEIYMNQARDEFITGKRSFDEWDKYLGDIQRMRGQRYQELVEIAYNRYKAS